MTWLRGKKAVVVIALVAAISAFAAVSIAQAMTASISGHTVSYSESITGTGPGSVTVTISGPGGFTDSNIHPGDPCGTFSGTFTLPANAQPGTYTIAIDTGATSCDWNEPDPVTVTLAAPAPPAAPVPGNPSFTG